MAVKPRPERWLRLAGRAETAELAPPLHLAVSRGTLMAVDVVTIFYDATLFHDIQFSALLSFIAREGREKKMAQLGAFCSSAVSESSGAVFLAPPPWGQDLPRGCLRGSPRRSRRRRSFLVIAPGSCQNVGVLEDQKSSCVRDLVAQW